MFCLEDVKSTEMVLNPIGCQCQLKSHGPCLQAWFEEKNQYECPICHAVSLPNPIQPMVHVVYIQREPVERFNRMNTRQQKYVLLCFCLFIGWGIIASITEFVWRR